MKRQNSSRRTLNGWGDLKWIDKGYEDSEVDDLFMEKWLLTNTLGREST